VPALEASRSRVRPSRRRALLRTPFYVACLAHGLLFGVCLHNLMTLRFRFSSCCGVKRKRAVVPSPVHGKLVPLYALCVSLWRAIARVCFPGLPVR